VLLSGKKNISLRNAGTVGANAAIFAVNFSYKQSLPLPIRIAHAALGGLAGRTRLIRGWVSEGGYSHARYNLFSTFVLGSGYLCKVRRRHACKGLGTHQENGEQNF